MDAAPGGEKGEASAAVRRPTLIIVLRSLAYHGLAYPLLVTCMLLSVPLMAAAPRTAGRFMLRAWARGTLTLARIVVGQRFEIRGAENIPAGGAIFASKHQSAWETIALLLPLPRAIFVLKEELMRLPVWGFLARRMEMISVDRAAGAAAMTTMVRKAQEAVANGAQLVIFPEGTRRAVGAPPDYKPGIVLLNKKLDAPCIPVALNSGVFWPKGSFLRYPGTITVSFLPALPAGATSKAAFLAALTAAIETETDRLVVSARAPLG